MRVSAIESKDSLEVIPVTIDFTNLVDQIDSVSITVSVKSGSDANPAALIFAPAEITGTSVQQLIQGGVDRVVYLIRMDIVSGSLKYAEGVYLQIENMG